MNNIKKINFLICLIFSFVFFFSNVFPVQAVTIYEGQTLEQFLDPKHPDEEIIKCEVLYTTKNQNELKVIDKIEHTDFKVTNIPWPRNISGTSGCCYDRKNIHYLIGDDGTSAKIFLTIERRNGYFCQWLDGKFDLIFEFQVT